MGVLDVPFNRNVNVNNLENPFGTYEGQQVVSTSENFWARCRRLGTLKSDFSSTDEAYTANTLYTKYFYSLVPSAGFEMVIHSATISTTTDATVTIYAIPGMSSNFTNPTHKAYVKAYTPFTIYFDGALVLQNHNVNSTGSTTGQGRLAMTVLAATGGTMLGSAIGFEMSRGDV